MECLREHIYRLHPGHFVMFIQKGEIPCLSGRITADVNDTLWQDTNNLLNHILMHSISRRICDDDIRMPMLLNKAFGKDFFHVPSEKLGVGYIVVSGIVF